MCQICNRIEMIKEGDNPYFIREFETGYLFISDYQHFFGSVSFICKKHVSDICDLDSDFRLKFLDEAAYISGVVKNAFESERVNLEISGNNTEHIKIDIYPRNENDLMGYGIGGSGSVWYLPMNIMYSSVPDTNDLKNIKEKLNNLFYAEI